MLRLTQRHSRHKSLWFACLWTLAALHAKPASVSAFADPMADSATDVPDGFMLIEGDIVPLDFYGQPEAALDDDLWPEGIVYFEWDANTTAENQSAMRHAMQQWIDIGGVAFVPRSGWEPAWIHIQNSAGNNSPVGMGIGQRFINIHNWDYTFIMAHELAHILGVWHEHSRPDRDTACNGGPCVVIELDNVCQDCCSGGPCDHNFNIQFGASTFGPTTSIPSCTTISAVSRSTTVARTVAARPSPCRRPTKPGRV